MPWLIGFRQRVSLAFIGGLGAIAAYLLGSSAARWFYPGPFSPSSNWLSDLGNPDRNPEGAAFYNWGCVLTAVGLLLVVVGLSGWRSAGHSVRNLLIRASQLIGIISVAFLAGIGFNPENSLRRHLIASNGFFVTFPVFILVFSTTLLLPPRHSRPGISLLGFGVVALGVLFHVLLPGNRPLEWATELGFLTFVGVLAWNRPNGAANARLH